ncbi:hypothetical protein BDW02DRAFT_651276 [Decorospora gaudefroyi]|uniref:Uncharacterized protein n=1 Tax=Decorospora gaudefroyi TaxID=184978 RepID=A0A6A5JXI5_9PLEO|nr:hypothetical protein BDW02DRAFT_651276 [Decorospora gaudefroyi]
MSVDTFDLPNVLKNLTWRDFDPGRNCTAAGRLFGQMEAGGIEEMSIFYLRDFAWGCAPVSMQGTSALDIVAFAIYNIRQEIYLTDLFKPVLNQCRPELCRSIEWEGNPDLSGIGILSAYIIQAVFATLFTALRIYKVIRSTRKGTPPPDDTVTSLPQNRLAKCFGIFWLSSLYFSLCTVIASAAINFIEKGTIHTMVFSFLSALFSTSVLLCLWPWYRRDVSSVGQHNIIVLTLVVETLLLLVIGAKRIHGISWESPFELYCFSSLKFPDRVTHLSITVLCYIPFLLLVALWRWHYLSKRPEQKRWRYWGDALALVSFLLMWISLGYFIQVRAEMSTLVGQGYAENEWGFGQLLALLAWLPTLLESAQALAGDFLDTNVWPIVIKMFQRSHHGQAGQGPYTGVGDENEELVDTSRVNRPVSSSS